MKKYGALIALGFAVLFGVLAVVLANRMMTQKTPEAATQAKDTLPVTRIVIAAQDIDIGTPLTKDVLTLAQWPKANVPKGAFERIENVEGRVAVSKLSAGEPLLKAELAEAGSGAGLVALIPPGMRAMSIRVDEVIGVAGFVLPNTYVDIVHVGANSGKGKDTAKIILQRVKVLAIAQKTSNDKAKVVRTVTLELTPEQATLLALKTREGSIHLLLRNPLEEKKTVVAEEAKPAPAPVRHHKYVPVLKSKVSYPPPTPHTVEVIRGSNRQDIKFKNVESEDIINQ